MNHNDYEPPVLAFLDAGFAVVITDYVGLGTPGVHPYLAAKKEGTAVVAAARAAQKFGPAQASGPIIISGHSQGGYAALMADYVAQASDHYAPGLDVRGVIALAPPTNLLRAAISLTNDRNPDIAAIRNLLIVAGSWHRLYGLRYPELLTKDPGVPMADALSDPKVPPSGPCTETNIPRDSVQAGELPAAWASRLTAHSVPTHSLPRTIPLYIAQAEGDRQVPYPVTLEAVREICASDVPVKFVYTLGGGHGTPLDRASLDSIESWARRRIRGDEAENNCAQIPSPVPLAMYTVRPGDTLSGIAQRFYVVGGWQALLERNRDAIADPSLIFPGQHLAIP